MDPHLLQLKSMMIDHDHPYCQPSYLDPITTLCIEPKFNSEIDIDADTMPIEIEKDESEIAGNFKSPPFEDCQLANFCRTEPIPDLGKDETLSSTPSSGVTWNITIEKPFQKIRTTLSIIKFEDSVHSHGSKHNFDEFRRHSLHELLSNRVARHIRRTFAQLNWRMDSCVELHERLLNTLPKDLLLLYLRGYVCLMGKTRIAALIRRLNTEISSHLTLRRFDYSRFLDFVSALPCDSFGYRPARMALDNMECDSESLKDSYSPITFIPADMIFPPNIGHSKSSSGRSSVLIDRPTFICVLPKTYSRSSRIRTLLRNLSKFGRLVNLTATGNIALQIRKIARKFASLVVESRPGPFYLIGFGALCSAVLAAATNSNFITSSEEVYLNDIICGRLKTDDTPIPTKSWLAAVVLIAPPRDTFLLDLPYLDKLACHFSVLVVVSARYRKEANTFRETLIKARNQAVQKIPSTTGLRGTPCVFDLRMLVIGGADYLLRMHPATLQRFATTQSAIDLAILSAVKNLTLVCQNLVKTGTIPVQAELMSPGVDSISPSLANSSNNNAISGSVRNGAGLPTVWYSGSSSIRRINTSNAHQSQTASEVITRRITTDANISRKASILRAGIQLRTFSDRLPPQGTSLAPAVPRTPSYLHPHERSPYSAGLGSNSMIRFTNGGDRVRYNNALCPTRPNLSGQLYIGSNRASSRFNGDEPLESPRFSASPRPTSTMAIASTITSRSNNAQSGLARWRGNRFQNPN